ncbi:MAG: YceI family protein [Bacteroidota bacterium]
MTTAESPVKTKWAIAPTHSEIAFKVKHLMITNVKGVFKEFEANINTGMWPSKLECW